MNYILVDNRGNYISSCLIIIITLCISFYTYSGKDLEEDNWQKYTAIKMKQELIESSLLRIKIYIIQKLNSHYFHIQ